MYRLNIKNMVCDRCKAAVRSALVGIGLAPDRVELGFADVAEEPDEAILSRVDETLRGMGFELLRDTRRQTVERIKVLIIEMLRHTDGSAGQNMNVSAFIADRMHSDYSALSKLFSAETGTTIEKYVIAQKVELVKELLSYGEMSLAEIALRLNYSSTAYLSSQFKSVTGMTPSAYKSSQSAGRCTLDSL